MKYRLFILTLLLGLSIQSVFALDVVYPKQNNVTINSPSTFFVGNSSTEIPLKINGQEIPVHPSGGFAYAVKLNTGNNQFVIEAGDEKQIFNITRPKPLSSAYTTRNTELPYDTAQSFMTVKDNTPLRSTPIDSGINRIAHYQKDIPLLVIGEKSGFYKVKLNETESAWINIKDVVSADTFTPAKLIKRNVIDDKNYYIFKIDFDKKVPYVIEGKHPFVVKFYNIEGYPENTFSFTFPLKQKLIGYSGEFEGNSFILKVRKFPKINEKRPLKNIKIVIDAGHGGDEKGAIGCLRHNEKDINLAISKMLATELKLRGANVIMTRYGDETVGLLDRVKKTNENEASVFISIHGNALPDNMDPNEHSGTSVFYYYPQAEPLADSILKSMTSQLPFSDDQVRQGSFAVVRNTQAISLLIEVGYLINPSDNAYLIDTETQQNTGKAIADGIENFFAEKNSN